MLVKNKWNNGMYEVVSQTDKEVTLKRMEDRYNRKKGEVFTIAKSEYYFNYSEKTSKSA